MDWYYVEAGKSVGPIAEDKMVQLIQNGKVSPDMLVWRDGMAEWKPCREAGPKAPAAPPSAVPASAGSGPTQTCAQCGNQFPQDDMMKFENSWVCANCKPVFLQKLKEGVSTTSGLAYGGFWIRFGAKFIDGILLQIVNYLLILPIFGLAGMKASPGVFGAAFIVQYLLNISFAIAFTTFFLGKYGATPGKMACRLKVVNPDGSKISYMKAFARYWGEILSGLTLTIGYLIAAWDDEKRALHDRVCSTRVVRVP